jgi:GTP-binding protein EngB required for normal cell division
LVGRESTAGESGLADLPERLEVLRELVRIGRARDGFDVELLAESETVLRRASERLGLSAGHTVVAIAGGTGSGKSTLFNALSGASFSPPGVIRPTTREAHACVWGMEGAAPLLDWLGVPRRHRYARASALDSGEEALRGLILLDLPDHDSVIASSSAAVDRIAVLADMLIWVLDPQKYADAAVHNRYLVPLARHAGVFTVVLNQIDLLTQEEADDCAEDLGRLLESEGLDDAWLHAVSARTGAGLDELRGLLADAISESRAASERIAVDIDSLLARYGEYAAGPAVPEMAGQALAGVAAAADATGTSGAIGTSGANEGPESIAANGDIWGDGASGVAGTGEAPGADGVGVAAGIGLVPALVPADTDPGSGSGLAQAPPKPLAKPPWEMTEEEFAELRAARNRLPWEETAPDDSERREPDPAELARIVPDGPAGDLTGAFADASGLSAVADGLAGARAAQAARLTGWPVTRVLRWRGPGGFLDVGLAAEGEGAGPTVGLAPQSEVDNAITAFADTVGGRLPEPWPAAVRRAARSRADKVPPALVDAVRQAVPGQPAAPRWWRLIAAWQWLLVVLTAAAAIWAVVIGVAHGPRKPVLLGDLSLVPWLVVLAVAMLLLGWLTSVWCRNTAVLAAERERDRAEHAMREQVAAVARDQVLAPVGQEIATYERFRGKLAVARGSAGQGDRPLASPITLSRASTSAILSRASTSADCARPATFPAPGPAPPSHPTRIPCPVFDAWPHGRDHLSCQFFALFGPKNQR